MVIAGIIIGYFSLLLLVTVGEMIARRKLNKLLARDRHLQKLLTDIKHGSVPVQEIQLKGRKVYFGVN